MQPRRFVYLLLAAALICAVSVLWLIYSINSARLQFQQTEPGNYNYLLQADRVFDRFDNVLVNYAATSDSTEREKLQRLLQTRFDIVWSTFGVFEIDLSDQTLVVAADELVEDIQAFLDHYDSFYSGKTPLNTEVVEATRAEIQVFKGRIHDLGLEMFEKASTMRDSIAQDIDHLYNYFWLFSLLLMLIGALLVTYLFRLNDQAIQLVSETRKSEERLASVVEELRSGRREQKAKDTFLAAASHDLRQPLHALGLFVSALENKVTLPEGPVILEKIKQSTVALNSLFNSLLDISRLDAGVVEATRQHFYIGDLLRNLAGEFREVAAQRNLAFRIDHADDVAHTDYVLLGRILRNLIDNAVVYTREGEISVTCDLDGDKLVVRVADTGPGIPASEHESIFSEYYQLNNPERDRNKGLGLGLSIVRRLTELLDIRLSLESEPGRGSVFCLEVPVGLESQVVTPNTTRLTASSVDLEGALVLLIDDERDVRQSMEFVLQQANCTVITAESEMVAQKIVVERDLTPALIIADYRLREGKTGDQAITLIRDELNIDIPALIVTGDTSPERVRDAAESGASLLHKPVAASELVAEVQSLLHSSAKTSVVAS